VRADRGIVRGRCSAKCNADSFVFRQMAMLLSVINPETADREKIMSLFQPTSETFADFVDSRSGR